MHYLHTHDSTMAYIVQLRFASYSTCNVPNCQSLHITSSSCDPVLTVDSWKQITHDPVYKFQLKSYLTQNMQDRQTQVRAGPARAVGKLRETDGMVADRSDAATATDQRASLSLIQPGEELPNAAKPWLSWMHQSRTHTLSFTSGSCFLPPSHCLTCFLLLCLSSNWILTASPLGSLCLSYRLPGKVSQSFFFLGWGGQAAPTSPREQRGWGYSTYYPSLLPLLSLSLIPSHPPLLPPLVFTPLSLTTFNFIHSLIPPPPSPVCPPQHPSHFTSPSFHLPLARFSCAIFHKLCLSLYSLSWWMSDISPDTGKCFSQSVWKSQKTRAV